MKKLKRTAALVLSALMALTLTACGARSQVEEQQAFDAFMHEQFVAAMQDDYLTAHVFLENPQDFGVDTSQMVVRINEGISAENTRENVRQMQRTREELQRFEREKLTAEQQDTYDLYLYQLDLGIESGADRFMYYGTLLEPMTGVHAQIPTLLADLQLRDEEDVQNLPELVKSVGPLFDSIIAFTREQADAGLLMLNIDEVSAYCKELVGKGEQGATLSAMQRNVDAAGFLSPQAKQAYKQQIAQAYTQAFLPAYQRLYEAVEALRGKPNNALGLAQFSDGKAYYELLFKYKTGSSRSIEEVKQQFSQMQKGALQKIQRVLLFNPSALDAFMDYQTPYRTFDDMLKALETFTEGNFPRIADVSYEIKPLDSDLAVAGIAAYFNLPAIDGTANRQIRVNTSSDAASVDSLDVFGTVAHEGFPGHMFQTAYAYEKLSDPWRKALADFSGYQEGYATYVELMAPQYLEDIPDDVVTLQQQNAIFNFCVTALADIGIHYEGWNEAQVKAYLRQYGVDWEQGGEEAFRQIQSNPGAFLPYYVGYMEFAALREQAETALGDAFDEVAFHEAILQSGSAYFDIVKRNVEAYIQSVQQSRPATTQSPAKKAA